MSDGAGFTLKSSQFRKERETSWRELEALLERAEASGLRSLTAEELNRLPVLYRSAVSSLSVAQAISLDRNLLDYLNALVGRAYLCVYGTKRRAGEAVVDFFAAQLPRVVRKYLGFVALSMLLLVLGTLTGYLMTRADPERYYGFVGDLAGGRTPGSTTEELRGALYETGDGHLPVFATMLFTHNSKIGMLCFALGIAAGVPVIYLLFANGLTLGALVALYDSRGLGLELWAWLLPHGITELGAICLCGAAGMVVGRAVVFPGRHTRLQNLAREGREVAILAMGAVVMLLVAGLIEGFFRQMVQSVGVRWALATFTLIFWTLYLTAAGRKARP